MASSVFNKSRSQDRKDNNNSSSSKTKQTSQSAYIDIIDKLDLSGLGGGGCELVILSISYVSVSPFPLQHALFACFVFCFGWATSV